MNIPSTSAANIARFSDKTSSTKGKQRAENAPFRSPIGENEEFSDSKSTRPTVSNHQPHPAAWLMIDKGHLESHLPRHHLVGERLVLDVPVVHERQRHDDDERREVLRVEHELLRLDEVAEVARQQRAPLLLLERLQRRLELVVRVRLALQVALDLAQLFACEE